MGKIGIFYGSSTGNTETVANKIKDRLADAEIQSIDSASINNMKNYDNLLLGSSTWGLGDLQDDWDQVVNKLSGIDLTGKKIALFGTGDQNAYPDTFADALGILYENLKDSKGDFVGAWSKEGYEFSGSKAEKDGQFIGLVLDEDNQSDMTDERIDAWLEGIMPKLI